MTGDTPVITCGPADLHGLKNLRVVSIADGQSLNEAIRVRARILETAVQLNTASQLSRNALLEIIKDTKVFARTSQSLVDAVHARFLELNDAIISQREIMKANGMCNNSRGDFDSSSGAATLNATKRTSQHLIIVPEHFSRKKYTDGNQRAADPSHVKLGLFMKCANSDDIQNDKVKSPISPWEGSQYKLTLVISLRSKVQLKFIFTAFVQNVAFKKYRRDSVDRHCQKKQSLFLKRCFKSILFEALSTRFFAISADQAASRLMTRKYLKPTFQVFVHLISSVRLSLKNDKRAMKHRSSLQKKLAVVVLRNNKNVRKQRAKKIHWATFHVSTLVKTQAFIAWMLAVVKKNILRKKLLRGVSSFISESGLPQSKITHGNVDENVVNQNDTEHKSRYQDEKLKYKILKSDSLSIFSDTQGGQKVGCTLTNDNNRLLHLDSDQELGCKVQDMQGFNILRAEAILSIDNFRHRSFQSLTEDINVWLPNSDNIANDEDVVANDEANSARNTANSINTTDISTSLNALASIKISRTYTISQHLIGGDSDDTRNMPEEKELAQPKSNLPEEKELTQPQSSTDNGNNRLVLNTVTKSFHSSISDGPRSVNLKSNEKVMGSNIRAGIIESFRHAVRENQSHDDQSTCYEEKEVQRGDVEFIGVSVEILQNIPLQKTADLSPGFIRHGSLKSLRSIDGRDISDKNTSRYDSADANILSDCNASVYAICDTEVNEDNCVAINSTTTTGINALTNAGINDGTIANINANIHVLLDPTYLPLGPYPKQTFPHLLSDKDDVEEEAEGEEEEKEGGKVSVEVELELVENSKNTVLSLPLTSDQKNTNQCNYGSSDRLRYQSQVATILPVVSETENQVLKATMLIRRCARFFKKLQSVRLISIAYRNVRRNKR